MSKFMIHPLLTWHAQLWTQKPVKSALLCAAAFLLLFGVAPAQTTSSISGTVRDTSDALVPGAKVTLINQASKATRSATSNNEGYFSFVAVQPATYSIQVARAGFESWKVTGIEVHPGDSLTVPKIKLAIGKVTESVVVTAEVAGVTLDSPEHSTLISSKDIERLSTTGRDALELISMLPGFTLNAGTGVQNGGPDYAVTSFGSAQVSSFGANGAAPQSGLVNVTSDGAQVIDPGDMGGTLANINMDQVQEVKVQTSNFSADEAKGPIVVNAVGKSGGSTFHGSLYAYARNAIFNSNDWLSNDAGTTDATTGVYTPVAKSPAKYFYPGGTIGGPVRVPGTKFNKNNHLTFWAGFEDYSQTSNSNGTFGGPTFGFIPTPRMLGKDPNAPTPGSYDFSYNSLAAAFNTPATASGSLPGLVQGCSQDWNPTAAYSNIAGDCHSPAGGVDEYGNTVPLTGTTNDGQILSSSINPAMATYTSLYPVINRTPMPSNGYASDGYNWVKNVMETNNGFQFHGRVDENFSDNLKLYGTYNWEKVNSEAPMNNVYYNPADTVPFPTPLYSNGYSDSVSLNLTKIVSGSATNELTAAGLFFNQPEQFGDPAKAQDTGTPWAAAGYDGGVLRNGVTQLPRIYSWETTGMPNFSFGNVPVGSKGQFLRKSSWNVTDNFTKIFRTHTIKAGVYIEQTRNNQVTLGSDANGNITFDRYDTCLKNETAPTYTPNGIPIPPGTTSLGNTVANFMAGCVGGYSQSSIDPNVDIYFNSLEFFATDEWKVNSKLTLTYGIRLSHLPPWMDAHGIGAAVWDPTKYNPIQPGVIATNPVMQLDTSTWPGISWHKRDSSIPVAGVQTRALFYSPRLGLAYDFRGNGKTVVRGGWGVYRSKDSTSVVGGALNTSMDLVDHQLTGNDTCTLDQLMNSYTPPAAQSGSKVVNCGFYGGSTVGFTSPSTPLAPGTTTVSAVDPHDDQQPVTYNYNFTLDQQLPFGAVFEIAYVGNQSAHLMTMGNPDSSTNSLQNQNVIPLGSFFGPDPQTGQTYTATQIANSGALQSDYRPYPNYQAINVPHHTNWSNYNAMQVSLNKQRGALVMGVNYTWSKAMAVRGNYDTGYTGDPVNASHDYGVVSFDRPQVINFSYSYQEGKKFHGKRALGWVLNNWEMSGITSIQSGPNLAILNGSTNFSFSASAGYVVGNTPNLTTVSAPVSAAQWLGSSDYELQPTVTCDPRRNLHSAYLSGNQLSRQYVNGNCFALPAQGTQGWWNLPDVHGPAFFKSDLSVYKNLPINDRQTIQLRMSAFNFLNHPIPSFSNNSLSALDLTFADPSCSTTTGVGCFHTAQAAYSGMTLQNAGFGYTPFKNGVRIIEFGAKYNF